MHIFRLKMQAVPRSEHAICASDYHMPVGSQEVWKLVRRRTAMQSSSKRRTVTPLRAPSTPWTSWHQPTVAPYLLACTTSSACCAVFVDASASSSCTESGESWRECTWAATKCLHCYVGLTYTYCRLPTLRLLMQETNKGDRRAMGFCTEGTHLSLQQLQLGFLCFDSCSKLCSLRLHTDLQCHSF